MGSIETTQGPAIPSSVTDLVNDPVRESLDGTHDTPLAVGGQTRGPERLKTKAFELFLEGQSLGEIARALHCSRQYLYKIALKHDWADRKDKLQSVALLDDSKYAEALDLALGILRSKITQRLLELEALCEKKNLKAIIAWLQMSGLTGKDVGEPKVPKSVEVYNDLSDQRQVNIIQEQRVISNPSDV